MAAHLTCHARSTSVTFLAMALESHRLANFTAKPGPELRS